MTDATTSATPIEAAPIPTGIRVASTICWLVGVLTIFIAVAVGIPAARGTGGSVAAAIINVLAGLTVCAAGYLVRQRRKSGALLVVLAWAAPGAIGLANGTGARGGSFLLFAAMLALLANWKYLR